MPHTDRGFRLKYPLGPIIHWIRTCAGHGDPNIRTPPHGRSCQIRLCHLPHIACSTNFQVSTSTSSGLFSRTPKRSTSFAGFSPNGQKDRARWSGLQARVNASAGPEPEGGVESRRRRRRRVGFGVRGLAGWSCLPGEKRSTHRVWVGQTSKSAEGK